MTTLGIEGEIRDGSQGEVTTAETGLEGSVMQAVMGVEVRFDPVGYASPSEEIPVIDTDAREVRDPVAQGV